MSDPKEHCFEVEIEYWCDDSFASRSASVRVWARCEGDAKYKAGKTWVLDTGIGRWRIKCAKRVPPLEVLAEVAK
jgi:hypothetical protein